MQRECRIVFFSGGDRAVISALTLRARTLRGLPRQIQDCSFTYAIWEDTQRTNFAGNAGDSLFHVERIGTYGTLRCTHRTLRPNRTHLRVAAQTLEKQLCSQHRQGNSEVADYLQWTKKERAVTEEQKGQWTFLPEKLEQACPQNSGAHNNPQQRTDYAVCVEAHVCTVVSWTIHMSKMRYTCTQKQYLRFKGKFQPQKFGVDASLSALHAGFGGYRERPHDGAD